MAAKSPEAKARRRRAIHARRVRLSAEGFCWECPNPAEAGSLRCEKHNAKNRARSKKRYEATVRK